MALDYELFIEEMQGFLKIEDDSLFGQGDAILAAQLDGAEMRKASEILNRSVSTLRTRERIAREFKVNPTRGE
jgi:hypothetical protein